MLEDAPFERVEPLFYKYSYLLMESEPSRTVAVWITKPGLNPTKLIPALVRYIQRDQKDSDLVMAIRYLEHCIGRRPPSGSMGSAGVDSAIYNYLLQLYAQQNDDTDLLRFLFTATTPRPDQRYMPSPLDLKYALRICTQHGKTRACVHIYSCMELYEEAVELALRVDIGLAKENASKPKNEEMAKRLWLMIARHLIEDKKASVKEALALLNECPYLKIEDILPFFPDFVVIDDFKPEICKSLQEYSEKIKVR